MDGFIKCGWALWIVSAGSWNTHLTVQPIVSTALPLVTAAAETEVSHECELS